MHRRLFFLIMLAAVGLRLALLLSRAAELQTDPDGYVAHARMLTEGKGFTGPYSNRPTAFRPPGYTLLIAAIPGSAESPERAVAMLHVAMTVLLVLCTRELAEQCGLSEPGANLAALFVAFDPLLIRYAALPMSEVASAATIALAMSLWQRAVNRTAGESSGSRPWSVFALAGLLLGVAALVRPVALVVAALLFAAEFVRSRWSRKAMRPVIAGLALTTVMMPWILRNAQQFHAFIPATSHGGYTLALGNNPDYYRDVVNGSPNSAWDGVALAKWQQQMIDDAAADRVPAGDESATDAWYYRKAVTAIRNDPASFVKACWLRVRRFWSISSITGDAATGGGSTGRIVTTCVGVWYAGMWLLVLAAAVSSVRPSTQFRATDLWLTVAAFMLMHTFYWTDTRMRAPLMPVLCVLAAHGLRQFWSIITTARRPDRAT